MKILVVDDEPAAVRDLSMVLNDVSEDFDIDSAGDAPEAISLCEKHSYDVLFVDIDLPGMSGLNLAKRIKELHPAANIIMVTAYPQYALDAHKLFVSGYILKPAMENDIKAVLSNLRYPVASEQSGLYVRCLGDFEAFYDGEPIRFHRSKTKELFAYLVDRRGSVVSGSMLRAILWEDDTGDGERLSNYFSQLTRDIKNTLEKLGCDDVLKISRNAYAIVPEKISCDYYRAIERDPDFWSHYNGEYMNQYSWGEYRS